MSNLLQDPAEGQGRSPAEADEGHETEATWWKIWWHVHPSRVISGIQVDQNCLVSWSGFEMAFWFGIWSGFFGLLVMNKVILTKKNWDTIPICSMYGIFTYIWVFFGANFGKYSIHGAYGINKTYQSNFSYLVLRMERLGAMAIHIPFPKNGEPSEPWVSQARGS